MKRRHLMLGSLAAATPLSGVRAQAAWPNKPVRFIVPFAPGGGTDTVSRLICDHLGKTFGSPSWSTTRAAPAATSARSK
jgi:tripartite-type tricarboxylate transporter receptor subunit TctC